MYSRNVHCCTLIVGFWFCTGGKIDDNRLLGVELVCDL